MNKNTIKKDILTPFLENLKERIADEIKESSKEIEELISDHVDAQIASSSNGPVVSITLYDHWRNDPVFVNDISFEWILCETLEIYCFQEGAYQAKENFKRMIEMLESKIAEIDSTEYDE